MFGIMSLEKKHGSNISSTYLKRIARKVGIPNPTELSLEDCLKERTLVTKKYKKLKQSAKQSRIQFIQNLATLQAARGNETVSNAISRINRNEETRQDGHADRMPPGYRHATSIQC